MSARRELLKWDAEHPYNQGGRDREGKGCHENTGALEHGVCVKIE